MSRNYWFISDTHFQHQNIMLWSPGPCSSLEERDEMIIDNWNSVVKQGDYVYHLGDVFFGSKQTFPSIWGRLKGSKRLIIGNHDDPMYFAKGGFFKKMGLWKVWHDHNLLFTHVPVHPSTLPERLGSDRGINVHGHTHQNGSPDGPYRSVCVELNNFTPVNLEELISES